MLDAPNVISSGSTVEEFLRTCQSPEAPIVARIVLVFYIIDPATLRIDTEVDRF